MSSDVSFHIRSWSKRLDVGGPKTASLYDQRRQNPKAQDLHDEIRHAQDVLLEHIQDQKDRFFEYSSHVREVGIAADIQIAFASASASDGLNRIDYKMIMRGMLHERGMIVAHFMGQGTLEIAGIHFSQFPKYHLPEPQASLAIRISETSSKASSQGRFSATKSILYRAFMRAIDDNDLDIASGVFADRLRMLAQDGGATDLCLEKHARAVRALRS